jgi:hypothetical protein
MAGWLMDDKTKMTWQNEYINVPIVMQRQVCTGKIMGNGCSVTDWDINKPGNVTMKRVRATIVAVEKQ